MVRRWFLAFAFTTGAIISSAIDPSVSRAQIPGGGGTAPAATPLLTVTAQETIVLQPVAVQMRVAFRAEGRKSEEALKSLSEHCRSAETMLSDLGRPGGSYKWTIATLSSTVPFVDNPETARQWLRRQAAQMQVNNPQMRGKLREMLLQEEEEMDGESDPLPNIHAANCRLIAEWPIADNKEDTKLDGVVNFVANLRRVGQSKEFRGTKLRVQLTEEELEQVMPLMGAAAYVSSSLPSTGSDLQVLYVGVLSEESEAAALKKCFEKAKGQASRLAAAANKELGEVRMLTSSTQPQGGASSTSTVQTVTANGVMMTNPFIALDAQERADRRILHSNPNELVINVNVQVGFEIR